MRLNHMSETKKMKLFSPIQIQRLPKKSRIMLVPLGKISSESILRWVGNPSQYWGKVFVDTWYLYHSINQFPCQQSLDGTVNYGRCLPTGLAHIRQCGDALLRLCPPTSDCCSREPITAKLSRKHAGQSGVDRVVTLDLHAVQVQGFFWYCRR